MKKILFFSLLLFLMVGSAPAQMLHKIRFGYYPEKIRVVFDFDASFNYTLEESKEKIVVQRSGRPFRVGKAVRGIGDGEAGQRV